MGHDAGGEEHDAIDARRREGQARPGRGCGVGFQDGRGDSWNQSRAAGTADVPRRRRRRQRDAPAGSRRHHRGTIRRGVRRLDGALEPRIRSGSDDSPTVNVLRLQKLEHQHEMQRSALDAQKRKLEHERNAQEASAAMAAGKSKRFGARMPRAFKLRRTRTSSTWRNRWA